MLYGVHGVLNMDSLTRTLSERARQLTREFLEPHTEVFKGAAELQSPGQ